MKAHSQSKAFLVGKIFFLTTFLLLCTNTISSAKTRVLIVGDSMGAYLDNSLESLCLGSKISNGAISGTTASDWANFSFEEVIDKDKCGEKWDVVYISLGANDVLDSDCTIGTDELKKNMLAALTNIITRIAPGASTYLLLGYCVPAYSYINDCSDSDFIALMNGVLMDLEDIINDGGSSSLNNPIVTSPAIIQIINSFHVCGGSATLPSDKSYFQDPLHLNSKGYCKVFTQPKVQSALSCSQGISMNCDDPDFELRPLSYVGDCYPSGFSRRSGQNTSNGGNYGNNVLFWSTLIITEVLTLIVCACFDVMGEREN